MNIDVNYDNFIMFCPDLQPLNKVLDRLGMYVAAKDAEYYGTAFDELVSFVVVVDENFSELKVTFPFIKDVYYSVKNILDNACRFLSGARVHSYLSKTCPARFDMTMPEFSSPVELEMKLKLMGKL